MEPRNTDVPLSIQVIAGAGAILLVVGTVLLGLFRLNHGTWKGLSGAPVRVTTLGVGIMLGTSLLIAVRRHREP